MNTPKWVALFWNPVVRLDIWGTNTVIYSGQKRTSVKDYLFEQPNTSFYVFKKDPKRGWYFVGKTVANRRVRDRIIDRKEDNYRAPLWEMTFEPSCHFTDSITQIIDIYHQNAPRNTYLTKDVLLHTLLDARPVSKAALSTGIIPFQTDSF